MDDWMKDPNLSGISAEKLQMLQSMASMGNGKGPNELLPILMAAANTSREKGMQFSDAEMDLIIQVMKSSRSPEEAAKIDRMLQMLKLMKQRRILKRSNIRRCFYTFERMCVQAHSWDLFEFYSVSRMQLRSRVRAFTTACSRIFVRLPRN